jgi:diguanylate cyclase (GGDEF)-like protein
LAALPEVLLVSSSQRSRVGPQGGQGGQSWVTGVGAAQDRIRAAAGRTDLILERLVSAVAELVDAHATVALLEGGELVRRAAAGDGGLPIGVRVETATSVCGEALRSDRPVRVADAAAPQLAGPDASCCPAARALLSVPLSLAGTTLGVVALTSDRPDWFDGVDENTVSLVAEVAADVLLAALPARLTPRVTSRTPAPRRDDDGPRLVDVTASGRDSRSRTTGPPDPPGTTSPAGPDDDTLVFAAVPAHAVAAHSVPAHSVPAQAVPVQAVPVSATALTTLPVIPSQLSPVAGPMPAADANVAVAVPVPVLPALGLWQWDAVTGLATLSDPVETLTGLPVGRPRVLGAFRALLHPDDVQRVERAVRAAAARHTTDRTFTETFRIVRRDGSVRTVQVWGDLQHNRNGLVGAVGAVADVTAGPAPSAATPIAATPIAAVPFVAALPEAPPSDVPPSDVPPSEFPSPERQPRARRSATDPVTGLPDRIAVERRAAELLAQPGAQVALVLLDVDRFARVNSSLGSEVGDRLLHEVARRIVAVVPAGTLVARTGGDEFAVLSAEHVSSAPSGALPDQPAARRLAEALTAALRMPYLLPGSGELLVCPVSLGMSSAAGRQGGAHQLLAEAEVALARAKEGGRDRLVVYDDALRPGSQPRQRTERLLRDALGQRRLTLEYQPIVDFADGRVVGAEALVRIREAGGGALLTPDAFLGVAEDTGLVVDLDRWVIDTAVAQVERWARLTPSGQDAPWLSVNMSARTLEHPDAVQGLLDAVRERRVAATDLRVEVTERSFLAALPGEDGTLRRLIEAGIPVGVDDFGTGYSALGYLRRFDLDFMKIDRSFVAAVGEDRRADAVVTAVVDLAHAHGMLVTAEGVETSRQARRLREIGCDLAQGFHFGHPAAASLIVAG